MAIKRIVVTEVYCDVCGEHVAGWESDDVGESRAWATYYAREKGCTVGKRVICKRCRIKERIRKCMALWEYRAKYYGETEEKAKAAVQQPENAVIE